MSKSGKLLVNFTDFWQVTEVIFITLGKFKLFLTDTSLTLGKS